MAWRHAVRTSRSRRKGRARKFGDNEERMGDGLPRERRLVLEGCRWEWRSISSVPCCGGKAAATSVGPRTSRRRPTHDPTANAAKIQRHAAQSRLRRGDRRRRLCRALHAASAAWDGAERARARGGRAASAAPGIGTAIPERAAMSRACSTRFSSRTSCSRSGTGASATPHSRSFCATPITWRTGSTCAATSSSTRG